MVIPTLPKPQAKHEPPGSYEEEWKASVETSQKFDEMLIDLRKYGFSIITGLITAGSFLGFSSKDLLSLGYLNLVHVGVINVSMFLILILFGSMFIIRTCFMGLSYVLASWKHAD